MISKIIGFEIPMRYANFCICGVTFVLLMVANLLPASAAVIGAQPGMLEAQGQPASAINSAPHRTFCSWAAVMAEAEEPPAVVGEAEEPPAVVAEAEEPTVAVAEAEEPTVAAEAEEPSFANIRRRYREKN